MCRFCPIIVTYSALFKICRTYIVLGDLPRAVLANAVFACLGCTMWRKLLARLARHRQPTSSAAEADASAAPTLEAAGAADTADAADAAASVPPAVAVTEQRRNPVYADEASHTTLRVVSQKSPGARTASHGSRASCGFSLRLSDASRVSREASAEKSRGSRTSSERSHGTSLASQAASSSQSPGKSEEQELTLDARLKKSRAAAAAFATLSINAVAEADGDHCSSRSGSGVEARL